MTAATCLCISIHEGRARGVSSTDDQLERLAAFELWDEEHFAPRADALEIARSVVNLAIDCDGGFFFEVLAEPGIERVERLDDVTQAFGLDVELALAAGIAAAESARQDNLRDTHRAYSLHSFVNARSRRSRSNLDPANF